MASVNAQQYGFGTGRLISTRQDIPGSPPIEFGTLQGASVNFSSDLKTLFGSNQYPLAVAAGKTKIEVKIKNALISANLFNNVFFGGTISAGEELFAGPELVNIPATTPFTRTAANAASFASDQGVYFTDTGQPATLVATLTASGQYTVNAATGVYTFYSADASRPAALSYTFLQTGANKGVMLSSGNPQMGVLPFFSLFLSVPYDQRQLNLRLPRCAASKLTLDWKQDDFIIPELDAMAWADNTGNAFYWSSAA